MHKNNHDINTKILSLVFFKVFLLLILIARLYYLQINQNFKYTTLAKDNSLLMTPILPKRGSIYDRNGIILATNTISFRLIYKNNGYRKSISFLKKIESLIDRSKIYYQKINHFLKTPYLQSVIIADDLSWQEVVNFETQHDFLPGCYIEKYERRTYPMRDITAPIIGYMSPLNDKQNISFSYKNLHHFEIGQTGLEAYYQNYLMGSFGTKTEEINVVGRVIRKLHLTKALKGQDLYTTINLPLQNYVYHLLKDQSACSITLNCRNGEILSLISTPSFNPEHFIQGISIENWKKIQENTKAPLINKATTGLYPPGSIFKIVVALAGLHYNIISPQDKISCPGYFKHGNHTYHCWKKWGHGPQNLDQAFGHSCDIYFYQLALKLGIQKIAHTAFKLGLGKNTKIDFPVEQTGLIPTPEWKKNKMNKSWLMGETIQAGIGQGYCLSTPLQLVVMVSRIINGGEKIVPHFSFDFHSKDKKLDFSAAHLRYITSMMANVCHKIGYTGYHLPRNIKHFQMGGKSSTSQVKSISLNERKKGIYKNEQREWKYRDHALFVGFTPVKNPHYATIVIVEHGGFGSKIAGPYVRDILYYLSKSYDQNIIPFPIYF